MIRYYKKPKFYNCNHEGHAEGFLIYLFYAALVIRVFFVVRSFIGPIQLKLSG